MTVGAPGKSSTGFDPLLVAAASYLFGFVSGVFLLVTEKDSAYVRFHAAQSTVVFIGVLVVNFLIVALPFVGWLLFVPFLLGVVALWLFLMFKALKGEAYKLPWIGDFAEDISR